MLGTSIETVVCIDPAGFNVGLVALNGNAVVDSRPVSLDCQAEGIDGGSAWRTVEMDAREYLARKGLDGQRDKEKPTTLEEKAWDRARGAQDHRPRAGTPHDWEDWERYHDLLAEGADQVEQKVDREAHRQATDASDDGTVGHFTPEPLQVSSRAATARTTAAASVPSGEHESTVAGGALMASPGVRLALMALTVLMPPLAVAVTDGGAKRTSLALLLMLLGWLPGVIYAAWWLLRCDR